MTPSPARRPWIAQQARSEGLIGLELRAAGVASLLVEDNSADRLIVQVLAKATVGSGSDLMASDLVERLAPVGHKKMLHAQARPMLLRPGRLPAARLVQPAVSAVVLDKLGEWLATEGNPQGIVSEDKRLDVLNKTVQHYFQRIQDLIASLTPRA